MREFEVNALNLLDGRKLDFLPAHFEIVEIAKDIFRPSFDVEKWVITNLKGRFYIGRLTKLDDNRVVEYHAIAFEDPKEATFFILGYSGQKQ